MCNIAGYVGEKAAAPILIDMMRREEGWDAGFYTGLATVHQGKIHCAKKTGDLEYLLRNTCASSLPGTVGLIHSRTPSGGGDAWAHPFLGACGREPLTAYVANGSQGVFKDRQAEAGQLAGDLEKRGYGFSSRLPDPMPGYPVLPGGGSAHMSDIMAQLVTEKIRRGSSAAQAMNDAFCQMPAEIVGLLLSLSEPDAIAWSRINMPMFLAFCSHGAYLASTPQAFPEDAGEPILLPACAGGSVYARRYTVIPYQAPPICPAPITPRLVHAAYAAIEQELKKGRRSLPELAALITPLFDPAPCLPRAAAAYSALYSLQKEGRLTVEKETRPGMQPGLTAPRFFAVLKPE